MASKPIAQLTDDDIRNMAEQELNEYQMDAQAKMTENRLLMSSRLERFHYLSKMLRMHSVSYLQFQKEAYDLQASFSEFRKEIAAASGQYLQLQRDWNRLHGKANVGRLQANGDLQSPNYGEMEYVKQ